MVYLGFNYAFLFLDNFVAHSVIYINFDFFMLAGFHVDDSEVTLNVCLGKQFTGGDLFFRGVRCDKHVNSETHTDVS